MSRSGAVIVHDDAEVLAEAVAARLINRLADAQAHRGEASIVLTGGRIAARVYANVLASNLRGTVDWSRVDFWWGDERFLPSGDPDRNETQAREAFLDRLPVDPARVHPMAAADEADTPEEAAERYEAELAASAGGSGVPAFDLLLLGIGEDGHVASLFPGNPALEAAGTVAGVRNSPKPPPERVSLTMPAINTATAAWIIASGEGKAAAVDEALAKRELPAGRVEAQGHTRWLIDRDAAAQLKHLEF
ncbi:6-phosphogluconolactonase [Glycomyces sp. TRM65418]|uniref:6-phosphogluconolactonase n=1 Tax=Glycomyces sp. TRM65418 TaxID=2867006 RepID=UPI001CE5BC7B|nr:6-phosphogluconolactonase [Glycomyces sp. TRM65418]MCC3764325.1 6-phosphogluconolactonase [Glycomyces sp. TRM65418]QZD54005.1 6-phosphogluconolactonase [Glycomyces sp. TRM65418]